MTTLTKTISSQEVKITDISENPGILPFFLHETKIQRSYHTSIHYYDLNELEHKLIIIQEYITKNLNFENPNNTLEVDLCHFTKSIKINLNNNFQKLNSILLRNDRNRRKRGLIDGLGTVIKFISGNLDQKDAEKFNKEIEMLKNTQNNMINKNNQQISLNHDLLVNYNDTITKLTNNQKQLFLFTKRTDFELDFLRKHMILSDMLSNLNEIHNFLTDLEIAITFTRENKLHTSAVKPKELISLISRLIIQYGPDSLPFDINNLNAYYSVIETSSFTTSKHIVNFVTKIPITYTNTFKQYEIIPIPNRNNFILIPYKPFITLNKETYWYSEEPCRSYGTTALCKFEDKKTNSLKTDCVHQLIVNKDKTLCELTPISKIKKLFVEQIDLRHYIVITNEPTKIDSNCKINPIIKNINLLELPKSCNFTIKHETYFNDNINKVKEAIILPDISIQPNINKNHAINLQDINLNDIHKLIKQSDFKSVNIPTVEQIIKYSWAPIYLFLIAIIIYIIYKHKNTIVLKFRNDRQIPDNSLANEETATPGFSFQPSRCRGQHPS